MFAFDSKRAMALTMALQSHRTSVQSSSYKGGQADDYRGYVLSHNCRDIVRGATRQPVFPTYTAHCAGSKPGEGRVACIKMRFKDFFLCGASLRW
jgi:hypothetical protein